jgi:ATP-dependent exoDNAse (exonuclease V) beta subunit
MGPNKFAQILLCQKYAGTVVERIHRSSHAPSASKGTNEPENLPDRVSSKMEYGNLMHESIQFVLTGPGTAKENMALIEEILEEVALEEEWTHSLLQILPKSSGEKEQGDDFDEDDALDLIEDTRNCLRFIEKNGWINAKWEKEAPVSGSIETKWGVLTLNGFVDLKGESEDGVVIIEIKSSRKYSDSWNIQMGLYSDMEQEGTYSEVAVWSPQYVHVTNQSDAIASLRLRTKPETETRRAIPHLCKDCNVIECPQRSF